MQALCALLAQTHFSGCAYSGNAKHETVQHKKGLFGEHGADLSRGVAQRDAVAQQETAVPQEVWLVGRREPHREFRCLRQDSSSCDDLAVGVVIRETGESFLEEAVEIGRAHV